MPGIAAAFGEIQAFLIEKDKNTEVFVHNAMDELTDNILEKAAQLTPVDTGRLQGAWAKQVGAGSGSVYNPTYYASWINYGHGYVHGGVYPPQFMLEKAVINARENVLPKVLNDILEEII